MEPAVSARPRLKTHESQTEAHHESTNPLNVCPVVQDEMDEENLNDKEEQSEESRAVRVGRRKTMTPTLAEREEHERTHSVSKFVQTLCRCTGKQSCSSWPKVCKGGRR